MTSNRADVRDFLVTRRAKITPEQAGLQFYGGNRRVPGLRREEVAMLAGVSADYYTRLEKGNLSGVSDSVLEAVATALQLDEAERHHLLNLARAANTSPARAAPRRVPQQIRPATRLILDSMTDTPAFIRNGRLDVLAINALGRALYSPAFATPVRPVNLARFRFLDPAARELSPTSMTQPAPPSPFCAPRPAATPSARASPTSSASSPPEARSSAPCGPLRTCASTTAASSTSATPPSATSTSCLRPWHLKLMKDSPSPPNTAEPGSG